MKGLPVAQQHANYGGDCTEWAGTHPVVGPNTLGEILTVVDATFDPETNRTRVGFAYGIHRPEPAEEEQA